MEERNGKFNQSKWLLVLLSATFAQGTLADTCGTINFSANKVDDKINILEMIGNNGEQVRQPRKYNKVADGTQNYYLAPGVHTLTVNQWVKKEFISNSRNIKRGRVVSNPPTPAQKTMLIDIKVNQEYNLSVQEVNGQSVINIVNSREKICDGDGILAAKKSQSKYLEPKLPEDLESQLRATMNKVANYQKQLGNNVFPHELNAYFGTVLGKSYAQNDTALAVNSVLPFSFADNLNLKAGDLIVSLGKQPIIRSVKSPSLVISEYLGKIPYGENVVVEVIRNGANLTLSNAYIPVVLPDSYYVIGLGSRASDEVISQSSLSAQLKFEYNQLLLAISSYSKYNLKDSQTIVLNRNAENNNTAFSLTIDLSSVEIAKQSMLKESKRSEGGESWQERFHKKKRLGSDPNGMPAFQENIATR